MRALCTIQTMKMFDSYRDDLQSLDSAMYCFISKYSADFTRDELETFRKAYGLIQIRQDEVVEDIRKEWRK